MWDIIIHKNKRINLLPNNNRVYSYLIRHSEVEVIVSVLDIKRESIYIY